MRIFLTLVVFLASFTTATVAQQQTEQEQIPLARFEITKGAFNIQSPQPRHALILYWDGRDLKSERINGDTKQVGGLGTFAGARLVRRLEKLNLPEMNYQQYFDDLAKRPRAEGKEYWIDFDGREVEIEIKIKSTTVQFKMWNPDTFFYNHEDDKIAAAVNEAVEAIIVTLGKSSVYW